MTEQELKDEREQAVKRGGEIYSDHYMEGLLDGWNKALSQPAVSGRSEQFNCGKERVFGEKKCDKQCDDCLKEYGSN